MAASVGDVMRQCRNYFETGCKEGTFTIQSGQISGLSLPAGRYIAIIGSDGFDGVWQVGDSALPDGAFTGRVWLLSPPAGFLDLCARIADYAEKNPAGALQSESFGNDSYTRGAAAVSGWQGVFATELAAYRLLSSEVMV